MSSHLMQHLSTDIHIFIGSFLDDWSKVYFGSSCIAFYESLIVNHFRVFKIRYTETFIKQYQEDNAFRERFWKVVKDPHRQIDIFQGNISNAGDFPFTRIHRLESPPEQFITHFSKKLEKIHDLELISFQPPDEQLSFQEKDFQLKVLSMIFWADKTGEIPLPFLPPSLNSLRLEGNFVGIPNEMFLYFSSLQSLHLANIDSLTDVSLLGKIDSLTLNHCRNITDITPLQHNRFIHISGCSGIMDYHGAFSQSKQVMISNALPGALFDVTHLQAVENLTIQWKRPLDLSNELPSTLKTLLIEGSITLPSFHRLFHLIVQNSDVVKTVEHFGCIPVLSLYSLNQVKTLHGLGYDKDSSKNLKNRRVEIYRCDNLTDFTALNTVHTVIIEDCKQFKNLDQVRDVKDLTISRCSKITEIKGEMRNERLKFKSLPMKKIAFNNLHHIRELDFSVIQSKDASLEGLDNLMNLERISLPADWKEGKSKGWKGLKEEYMKYFQAQVVNSFVIYIRKRNERTQYNE